MATSRRAPGKMAARFKKVKSASQQIKDKAKKEARDFTMAYQENTGSKLDRGYKKSARIARRVERKTQGGKITEYKGESIDLSRKRKAVKQIASSMNTSLTGRELKKNAKKKYAQIKEVAKQKANPGYAARQNAKKRSSVIGPKSGSTPGACSAGAKKSMGKKGCR